LDFLDYTRQKLLCILAEAERLLRGEFPHEHSRECLLNIETLFNTELSRIAGLDPGAALSVKQAACQHANMVVARFHDLLGFVLRSTNVRNAFEIFDPLLRISKQLLGPDAKLVLSSEWYFSPFTFASVFPELPEFVFIGLPASESENCLVMPLAGHELGHNVWRKKGFMPRFDPQVRTLVVQYCDTHWTNFQACFGGTNKADLTTDMLLIRSWTPAATLALRQSEEVFCDFTGVRLFGESFLNSFEYLIAPNIGSNRQPHYPPLLKRAEYMTTCAQTVGANTPNDFAKRFFEASPTLTNRADVFLLAAADWVTDQLIPDLIKAAIDFADAAAVARSDATLTQAAVDEFKRITPAFAEKNQFRGHHQCSVESISGTGFLASRYGSK
jgi:hypothetical protein